MNPVNKVYSKVKRISTELLAPSFLSSLITRKIKGNYILMYHGVTTTGSTQFNRRHVSFECLKKQITFLKKNFSIITLSDFFEEKFDKNKANFTLTFDDGYLNNYVYARSMLEQYECPATFFITGLNEAGDNILWADYVNIASTYANDEITIEGEKFRKKNNVYYSGSSGKSIYDIIKKERAGYEYKLKVKEAFGKHVNVTAIPGIEDYWQLMNDRQIRETANSKYIKIGCHGYYHNNLGSMTHKDACEELAKAKKYLENLTQYDVRQLAYPDGSYTLQLTGAANDMGFKMQLAIDDFLFEEQKHDPFIKKRYGIYTVDSCLNQLFTAIKII